MSVKMTDNEQVASSLKKYANIPSIGLLLFLLAGCYCVYRLIDPQNEYTQLATIKFTKQLKLVSAFNRHGDRAPGNVLAADDPHGQWTKQIWPNGISNLTDLGKFRQYRLGLELRRRCQESAAETLRGLFSNEWPIGLGLRLAREYTLANCSSNDTCTVKSKLPDGFSWPSDYKNIPIDTQTLPMLSYEYLHRCKYRLAHPAPGEADLRALKGVKDLPDLKELEKILDSRYATKFDSTALDLWSTINDELRLIKTRQTIDWSKRHFDWINKPIGSNSKAASNKITLFELYEQVVVLGYRYTTVGVARYVQVGPILTSLLESQKMALNYPNTSLFESSKMYANKKVILYSSHDEIMQLLMDTLSIFDTQEDRLTFEQRSYKWATAGEHEQFLAGLRMPKFGISMLVELWEAREAANGTANRLAYLQAYLYNREDALAGVKYRRLEFGSICVRLFRKLYPNDESYLQFFAKFSQFKLDEKFSCPFELFKNVTSNYMISARQLSDLCD